MTSSASMVVSRVSPATKRSRLGAGAKCTAASSMTDTAKSSTVIKTPTNPITTTTATTTAPAATTTSATATTATLTATAISSASKQQASTPAVPSLRPMLHARSLEFVHPMLAKSPRGLVPIVRTTIGSCAGTAAASEGGACAAVDSGGTTTTTAAAAAPTTEPLRLVVVAPLPPDMLEVLRRVGFDMDRVRLDQPAVAPDQEVEEGEEDGDDNDEQVEEDGDEEEDIVDDGVDGSGVGGAAGDEAP